MKNPILSKLIPGYEDALCEKTRTRVGKLSGLVGIGCNSLLFAVKLVVGNLCGSVSVIADAMNNLSDATSSVVTLVGFRLAEKPADAHHPYGHARYEYLSGLAVAVLILFIGFELAKSSVEKLLHPVAVTFSPAAVLALLLTVAVKLWMAAFNHQLGQHISSKTLLAAAADSRNDVITTSVVLVAGVIESVTGWTVDGAMGLAVAAFIFYSGIGLAKDTISPLLGEAVDPQLRRGIADILRQYPQVLGYHDLMVHDYGPGKRFATVHVEMDHDLSPLLCHGLIDDMERRCLEKHKVQLVIHYDPVITDDGQLQALRALVAEALRAFDSRLSLHDFRLIQGEKQKNVFFDVTIPSELQPRQEELRETVTLALGSREGGPYSVVITFDPEVLGSEE